MPSRRTAPTEKQWQRQKGLSPLTVEQTNFILYAQRLPRRNTTLPFLSQRNRVFSEQIHESRQEDKCPLVQM